MLFQMGIPGGPELLVMLLVMLILFGVPLLIVVVGGYFWFRSREDSRERLQELETEIEELKAELRSGGLSDDGGSDAVDSGDGTDGS